MPMPVNFWQNNCLWEFNAYRERMRCSKLLYNSRRQMLKRLPLMLLVMLLREPRSEREDKRTLRGDPWKFAGESRWRGPPRPTPKSSPVRIISPSEFYKCLIWSYLTSASYLAEFPMSPSRIIPMVTWTNSMLDPLITMRLDFESCWRSNWYEKEKKNAVIALALSLRTTAIKSNDCITSNSLQDQIRSQNFLIYKEWWRLSL